MPTTRSRIDLDGPAQFLPQRPLAAAAFTEAASAVGWRELPSWYLVSDHDNAIPPDCERFMAQRVNAGVAVTRAQRPSQYAGHWNGETVTWIRRRTLCR
jgi:hypothetical protein